MVSVVDMGDYFIVIENIRGKPTRTRVDIDDVNRSLKVIKNIDETEYKNSAIPCRRIAGDICKQVPELRDEYLSNGEFMWSKFFGTRKDYFKYYYYPQKVLQYKGFIDYTLRGYTYKLHKIKSNQSLKGQLDEWL